MSQPVLEEVPQPIERSQARQYLAMIVISTTTALAFGLTLRTPTQLEANDISRWCTIWSLLERGSYVIDECPWQSKTQDKVKKAIGPASNAVEHFYSSKPPLLPTLIAGILYPARSVTGVPVDVVYLQERLERNVQKEVAGAPGETVTVKEKPEAAKWPVYVFYFKPTIILLNIVPMMFVLVLYARLLDRYAANDWAWFLALFAAAFGTLLFSFEQTLNNHTVAAWSAFFAIYAFVRIWDEGAAKAGNFIAAGFFGAFCACNELPAALFGILLFAALLFRFPRQTLMYFAPAAAIPCAAFLTTQYLAFGQFRPVYEEFGTKAYEYEGSYWNTPLEMDRLNKFPESYPIYLFHMTVGHHGVFSLTPVFLFSIIGAVRAIVRRGKLSAVAWMTLLLTAGMLAFYTWNPKARNYGGSTQGLRWLFWVIPFWLVMLPDGLEAGQSRRWYRWLTLIALAVSICSVGYALRTPWSHPWILDLLEHCNLYTLER
jgi:hypothetical protein